MSKYTEHESFGLGWRAIKGCKCIRCTQAFKNPPVVKHPETGILVPADTIQKVKR